MGKKMWLTTHSKEIWQSRDRRPPDCTTAIPTQRVVCGEGFLARKRIATRVITVMKSGTPVLGLAKSILVILRLRTHPLFV